MESSKRRGRRAWTMGAGLSLCACALGAGCGGSGSSDEVTTPGFEASTAPDETEPFELAQPNTTAGPTTAPSGGLGGPTSTEGEDGTEPAPPTTAPPREPVLLPVEQITSVCGLAFVLSSYGTLFENPEVDAREAVDGIRTNLDRYVEVAEDEVRAAVETVAEESDELLDQFEASGYDRSLPLFQDLVDGQGPETVISSLLDAVDEVVIWEQRNCDDEET